MPRVIPWGAGPGELVARPVARGRSPARLRIAMAGPTGSPWARSLLWAALVTAGVAALAPVVVPGGTPVPAFSVINRLSGVCFAACGIVAWRRRPDSAVGRLLTVTGFGVLLGPILEQLDAPVASTLATLVGELWVAGFAALILSFVSGGRLTSTTDRVLVGAFVVALLVLQFAVLLVLDHPDNVLLVAPDAGLASALDKLRLGVLVVAALAVAAVTAERWRAASRPRRRALLPSLAGSTCALLYAAWLTSLVVGAPVVPLMWILNAALLLVPAALLYGLLRSRLARGELADLFRELGALRGVRLEAGLARALGDPGLVVAYQVPGEQAYIDGRGRPVDPPAPGGDRGTAVVERDGRRLGLLIYDAALDDDPELVQAVAGTAAIALDDARLQAESEDRLAELRASRERLVAAGDAERRRLERNLHDGAQQRLVSLALQLRMAQSRIPTDPALATELLASAGRELSASLEELRELARGLHPAVLDHGLAAALDSLAARAPVPTAVQVDPPGRLPEPVELAAYFVACEALANVAKYARATEASVRVTTRDGITTVRVADDGVGGADETAGTGLRGLADRVAALGGTLRISSPPRAGTVVTAELPCAS